MVDIPVIMGAAGAVPTPPITLRNALTTVATGLAPGLTTNLPASLIEDVASTAVGALVQIDQARVETINSNSPLGANLFTLLQFGNLYLGDGTPNPQTNTTVQVVLTGTPNFALSPGFTVSDGTNEYVLSSSGSTGSTGTSLPLTVVALNSGSFVVPANTVTTIVTSLPPGVTLTVTNPQEGTSGAPAELESDYRARILQAGRASAQGMPTFVKTQLAQVPGIPRRLIAMPQTSGGFKILVSGYTDQTQVGAAILAGLFDITRLTISENTITGITQALPPPAAPLLTPNSVGGTLSTETVWVLYTYVGVYGETQSSVPTSVGVTGPTGQVVCTTPIVQSGAIGYNVYSSNQDLSSSWVKQNSSPVPFGTNFSINTLVTGSAVAPTENTTGIVTTSLWNNVVNGSTITIAGVTPSQYNGSFTATVFTPTTFSTGVDTSGYSNWVSGGVVTPNVRNVTASINDYPDTYEIPFVNSPQQTVTLSVTWNTSGTYFVDPTAVQQAAAPALAAYINSIGTGLPILVHQLEQAFLQSVANFLPPYLVNVLFFAVSIAGVGVAPLPNTVEILGDPESFFLCQSSGVTVQQAGSL